MNSPPNNFGVPTDSVSNEQKLHKLSRISYHAFKGGTGAFFGVAVLTLAARMVIRIRIARRRLSLDDYFLLFGLICLCGATGLVFHYTRIIFLSEAIASGQTFVVLTAQDLLSLLPAMAVVDSWSCLIWTATFCVKFSFLALFRMLIRRISRRITIYYWIVVTFTAVSWAFMMTQSFIFCPNFGLQAVRCLSRVALSLYLNILASIFDITTDIMIVSIPILILRKSQLKPTQKLGLGVFLCLSLVMVLINIIRMSAFGRHRNSVDGTWQIFWLNLEGCVAIIMGSLTAFRTLFVQGGSNPPEKKKKNNVPLYSIRERLLRKTARSKRSGWEEVDGEHLPKVPSATLTGIRTFIYHNGRSSVITQPMSSETYAIDEELNPLHRQMGTEQGGADLPISQPVIR